MKRHVQEIKLRKQISEAIMAGQIDDAVAMLNQMAPTLLAKHPALNFRLLCQKFMGMVRGCTTAMSASRGHIGRSFEMLVAGADPARQIG